MKNFITLFIIVMISLVMLGACSSSQKMRKKCLDCPEFSLKPPETTNVFRLNENI